MALSPPYAKHRFSRKREKPSSFKKLVRLGAIKKPRQQASGLMCISALQKIKLHQRQLAVAFVFQTQRLSFLYLIGPNYLRYHPLPHL